MSKARVFLGTSGYSYQHWKGVFYPKNIRENRWLEYYAGFFDKVELNVTFYRLPEKSVFLGWYKKTPKNFKFAVKGSRFITHQKRLKDCSESLKLFFSRARPLKEKLGVILWQLPPSFKADPERLKIFFKSLRKYKNLRHAFEFRNNTWYYDEIFKILKAEGAALVNADWPAFDGNVHPVTADFAYLRRHGSGAKLYGGCYSKQQLKSDADVIKQYSRKKQDVYMYFNNDAQGYAVRNATQLKKILIYGRHEKKQ